MTLRVDGHSWGYRAYGEAPSQHRYGRGMWHAVEQCHIDKCGVGPGFGSTGGPDEVDDFADAIKAAITEHGNPIVKARGQL